MAKAALFTPSTEQRFVFSEKQLAANKVLAGPQRNTLLVGGSRSGKTTLIVRAILLRAYKAPASNHVIFRLRSNAARASIALGTLPKVSRFTLPGIEVKEHRQDGLFVLPNESRIWIAGLDSAERCEKILGLEFSSVYLNESSQIPWSAVELVNTRLAESVNCIDMRAGDGSVVPGSPLKQKFYCDLNPSTNLHWTYLSYIKGLDPASKQPLANLEDYAHFFLNPTDNNSLSPEYIRSLQNLPERARRRFLSGQYISAVDDALFTIETLEAGRVEYASCPDFQRVTIAVDPSGHDGSADSKADAIGIVVVAKGLDGHAYVLEDATMMGSPEQWGAKVVELYKKYRADNVTIEKNFGGSMCRAVIQAADSMVPCVEVVASRGKVLRAEPVSSLYAPTGDGEIRVHHVGPPENFIELEDELLAFSMSGYTGPKSPNRADALVHGVTALMLNETKAKFCFG